MTTGIDIATLIVYIGLLNPVLYCLWKHGKAGILGWLCLQSFCLVRIVGAIVDLHNNAVHSTSSDSLLLANIGLSPLLLAALGVLHESRTTRNPNMNRKWEWFRVFQYHSLVIGAILLVIFGVIKEMDDEPHTPGTLIKVGVIGVLLAWGILCTWTLLSWFQPPEHMPENQAYNDGTTLLLGVLFALPFLGLRELYGMLSVFIKDPNFKNNTAAKVVLSVIPEMIVTVLFAQAGTRTRNINRLRNMDKA
ncbi:hypothetical protein V8E51_015329 [Hyaloscypha variabilis]